MNEVTTLRNRSIFGVRGCFLAMTMLSSSAPRHRRHRAAMRVMLAFMLAHAGIVRHDMQMLAAPLRARIAEPHSMHHIRMQAAFAPRDASYT